MSRRFPPWLIKRAVDIKELHGSKKNSRETADFLLFVKKQDVRIWQNALKGPLQLL